MSEPAAPSRTRRLLIAAKVTVSLGLLGWLFTRMLARDGIDALTTRLGELDAGWLALAVALHFLAVLAGVSRWSLLLRAARIEMPFTFLLRSFLVGRFVGAFTPSTTGLDGWRLYEVGRASGAMGRSAAAIVVEKLVGLIAMAIVCAALVPLGGMELVGPVALYAAFALALGASVGLALLSSPRALDAIAARAPGRLKARAKKAAEALLESRLSGSQLARAVGLGVLSHVALSSVFLATAHAVGIDGSTMLLLATGNAIVIAVLLPVSIGGVGVREGVAVFLLAAAGVSSTDAVLVALLGYLTGQIPALLGGIASMQSSQKTVDPVALAAAEQTLS